MKLLIGLALVSLAAGATYFPSEKVCFQENLSTFKFYNSIIFFSLLILRQIEVEVINNGSEKASGRIAVPPPIFRKINGAISSFLRIIITSLLTSTSAPNRNGGIVQIGSPALNPIASPIINSGAVGALIGGGASPLFYPPVRINVDQSSQLYVPPGTDGRIIVLLKNDGPGDFFFITGGDDKNFFLQFDYNQYVLFSRGNSMGIFTLVVDDMKTKRNTASVHPLLPLSRHSGICDALFTQSSV